MTWLYIVIPWLAFYLISHSIGLVLLHSGIWEHLTPRDIYVCTAHSRITSFIIWLFELVICPFVIIPMDVIITIKWIKWKKEEYRRYHK